MLINDCVMNFAKEFEKATFVNPCSGAGEHALEALPKDYGCPVLKTLLPSDAAGREGAK